MSCMCQVLIDTLPQDLVAYLKAKPAVGGKVEVAFLGHQGKNQILYSRPPTAAEGGQGSELVGS